MRTSLLLLALTAITAATLAQAAASPPAAGEIPALWTARQAVAFAIAQNPESGIARKRIEQAQAAVAISRASDYPQVGLRAEYGQTDNPMYAFGSILNQGGFDERIDFNAPGRTDNLELRAQLGYQLYDGGHAEAGQLAARAHLDLATADLETLHQQLAFEAVRSFQAIVQAMEMVTVREESLAAITSSLDVGRARFDAGDLLRQDLLNLELQRSLAIENLIRSRHTLELAKRSFLNLLGLSGSEVAISTQREETQEVPEQLDFQNRQELRQLRAREEAAHAVLAQAESGSLPTVDAFAGYQINQGWVTDEAGDSWMAGVRLNYNLFDGHRTTGRITLARLKLQELVSHRQKTELALNLDIQQAQLDYEQAGERLVVTEKMVGVAEEVARLSRARFREGVILASDLIDFELRLSDAQARHLAAGAGYRTAIANLRRAAGLAQFSD